MSFTTRCPACGTTFKIVPDQLKISDGWVRCGHCADVFDATLFLEGEAAPVASVASVEPAVSVASEVSEVSEVSAPVHGSEDNEGDWLLHPASLPPEWVPVEAESVHSPDTAMQPAFADDAFVEELRRFAQSSPMQLPEDPSDVPPVPPVLPEGKVPAADASVGAAPAEGYDLPVSPEVSPAEPSDEPLLPVEPGFVRQARRRAFWHSRGMRTVMVVVSLLLGLALLAQHAVHERDRLAARYPAAAPLLQALCVPTGCQIGPVRQIESVVIDSSNLVRRLGNFYSFDFVLKNSAQMPVAVPALELSLTDTHEAVIVRRVFLPAELPGAPQLLPAQGQLSLSLRLSIADTGVSSMSGYRALVFYP